MRTAHVHPQPGQLEFYNLHKDDKSTGHWNTKHETGNLQTWDHLTMSKTNKEIYETSNCFKVPEVLQQELLSVTDMY